MRNYLLFFVLFLRFLSSAQQLPQIKTIVYDSSSVKGYLMFIADYNLIVMDGKGEMIYYYPAKKLLDFTLEPDRRLYFVTKDNIFLMDSMLNIIDTYGCKNGIEHDSHDRKFLPDGHLLLLGNEKIKVDLNKYPKWKDKCDKDTTGFLSTVLQEQDEEGNVVFEWHAKDHYDIEDADYFYDNNFCPPQWAHSNSIELDEDGNILLSLRNFNEITKINRKNGSIMWRWGGKHNEFKFVNCPQPFYGQHNIRMLPDGHFTLFDNGNNIKPHAAKAEEFELDEVNKIATLKWSYTFDDPMSSNARGNVQRLPDGNTLVNFGLSARGNLSFVVVNHAGKKLFQLNYSPANTYKVMNYTYPPFKLIRPVINCFDSAGVKYLDAGAGYTSYKWNTGDSTRVIKVLNAGSYSVFVPYNGKKGYISSEKYILSDIEHPCGEKLKQ